MTYLRGFANGLVQAESKMGTETPARADLSGQISNVEDDVLKTEVADVDDY